ncbi:MAG TPA: S8 family serine peptidase, partial [Solirubrobacterales bacterium]|nr:S8 family serine peptidase [Solirubrobacterales bacterium]
MAVMRSRKSHLTHTDRPAILFVLACAFACLIAGSLSAAVSAEETQRGYIVVLRDQVKGPAQVAREHVEKFDGDHLGAVFRHAIKGYAAEFSDEELTAVRKDPRVDYVEPDAPLELAAQTASTGIKRVFGMSNGNLFINQVNDKWADVDVAVLDTGSEPSHPDLNIYRRTDCYGVGVECIDGAGTPEHNHGSAVAGIIGAIDNGSGVVGVAHGARIWSVKVYRSNFGNSASDYFQGLDWVKAHADEIEVINSSVTAGTDFKTFEAIQQSLNDAGVINIAAAGNEGWSVQYVPGASDLVVTVSGIADYNGSPGGGGAPPAGCSAAGADDQRATFSNYGPKVDITAPAVCVATTATVGSGVIAPSGTSFAAPHVAGAAALLAMQKDPDSAADVEWIKKTLEEEGNLNWTDTSGDGIKEPLLDVGDGSTFDMRVAPDAKTGGASELQATTVKMHGSINPRNDSTTYQVEYGPSTSYGSKAPTAPKSAGSGVVPVAIEEPLTNLTPSTTYHYRLVATNSKGTVYGADRTFTTPRRYVPRFDAESY